MALPVQTARFRAQPGALALPVAMAARVAMPVRAALAAVLLA